MLRHTKCLKLSHSSNAYEAAAALRQAQKLMQRFDLTESDAALLMIHERRVTTARNSVPVFMQALVTLVGEAFACRPVLVNTPSGSWQVAFIGAGHHPRIAAYAFTTLRRSLEQARKDYIRRLRLRSTKVQRGAVFALGWIQGVKNAAEALAVPADRQQAIQRYMAEHYPSMQQRKARNQRLSEQAWVDHARGFEAGRKVRLRPGVAGQNAAAYLTASRG